MFFAEPSIDSIAQAGALEEVIRLGKSQPALLSRLAVVFAQLVSSGMMPHVCGRTNGAQRKYNRASLKVVVPSFLVSCSMSTS